MVDRWHPDGAWRVRRAAVTLLALLIALNGVLGLAGCAAQVARAAETSLTVSGVQDNPYHAGGHLMRGGSGTGGIVYCAQGYLKTPVVGQKLTRYGSLDIPELDYVLYHGYDGEIVRTVAGLDEVRSEAATAAAIWLAIGEQRPDVLSYQGKYGTYHGNQQAEERWEELTDDAVKRASRELYDQGLAYKAAGGGGVEAGCATYWANGNTLPDGSAWYQGVLSVQKRMEVTFAKGSANTGVTSGNANYAYAGASYDIYEADTNKKVSSVVTDGNGRGRCDLVPGRRYYAVETKAPAGFTLNTDRVAFTASVGGAAVKLLDKPGTVKLTIRKKDSATGNGAQPGLSLGGAEYRIVSTSTPGWQTTAKTNAAGTFTVSGVPLGRIVVTETKAPTGYKLDPTPHTYEVLADRLTSAGVATLEDEFTEGAGSFDFDLVKYADSGAEGSGLQKPVAGVKFQIISNTTGKVVGTLTTDERGMASTADPQTVNPEAVAPGKTYDTSKPWMGAGKRTAGHKGALPFDNKGYTVHEVPSTTPEGYQPCPDWKILPAQVVDGATLHYIVDNDFVSSRIQIVKTDAASGQAVPLAGFTFKLLDANKKPISQDVWYPNHAQLSSFTTDASGCVTLPGALKPGTYYVREAKVVAPYLLNGEDVRVEIENDASTGPITLVQVANDQAKGSAVLAKRCVQDGCAWCAAQGGKALDGAEFDVVALEDVVSPDGTVQAAAGQVLDHVVTVDGRAKTKPLPLGAGRARYAFVETKAPVGHVVDKTPAEFELSWKDGSTPTVTVEVEAENAPTETVVEKTILGTGAPLEGAVFDLWPDFLEMSNRFDKADAGALALTLAGGFESYDVDLTQQFGYAKLELEAPAGYTITARDATGVPVAAHDEVAPGMYAITVFDAAGAAVDLGTSGSVEIAAGTSYRIRYDEGLLGWGEGLEVEAEEMKPNRYTKHDFKELGEESDVLELEGIAPGTYRLMVDVDGDTHETTLFVIAGRRSFAEVDTDGLRAAGHGLLPLMHRGMKGVERLLELDLTTDEAGRIDITHLPARCEDLIGLLKAALRKDGVSEGAVDRAFDGIDANGSIAWRVQEIAAPDGYVVDPTVHSLTIHEDGTTEGETVYAIPVENDYTKVEIGKRSTTTEAELAGAELSLTDSEGRVCDRWTSGNEPHRVNALAPGSYTLSELKTPGGYDTAGDLEVIIEETGDVQRFVMYDKPIEIAGEIDKRQEIADPVADHTVENGDGLNRAEVTVSDEGAFEYSLDYRSTSSSWTDEFTVEDRLDGVEDGLARLTGITTAQAFEDYDGLMNVWYTTNQTPLDYLDDSGANATLQDGHENPWLTDSSNNAVLGSDGRALSYTGWRLWKADVPTTQATRLDVDELGLVDGEAVTAVRFEYGRVEGGFTTRRGDWDRLGIKNAHDDVGDVATEHGAHFVVDGEGVAYAPARIHMEVTDAYAEGIELSNTARVDLYRNGGGPKLEDHDDDRVVQVPKTEKPPAEPPVPEEPEEPQEPEEPEPPAPHEPDEPEPVPEPGPEPEEPPAPTPGEPEPDAPEPEPEPPQPEDPERPGVSDREDPPAVVKPRPAEGARRPPAPLDQTGSSALAVAAGCTAVALVSMALAIFRHGKERRAASTRTCTRDGRCKDMRGHRDDRRRVASRRAVAKPWRFLILLAVAVAMLAPGEARATDIDALAKERGERVFDLAPATRSVSRILTRGGRMPGQWVVFKDDFSGSVRQVSEYHIDPQPADDGSVGVTVRTTMSSHGTGSIYFTTSKRLFVDGNEAAFIGPDYRTAGPGQSLSQEASFRVSGGGEHRITSVEEPFREGAVVSAGWDFTVDVPYVITASAGAGGGIEPSGGSFVDAGATKTYAIASHAGYRIGNVKVDGVDKGALSSFSFRQVSSNHSISASFVKTHRVVFKDRGTVLSDARVDDGTAAKAPKTPQRTGYTFDGWSADFSHVGSDMTIEATWRANSYTVAFLPNGGAGRMDSQKFAYDQAAALAQNAFTRTGYTWTNWATRTDGSGTTYANRQQVKNLTATDGGKVSLHAQWKPNTYRIAFDANGGSGSMDAQAMTYDTAAALKPQAFDKVGYTWTGWNTRKDGSGAAYRDRQSVKNLTSKQGETVTLYAQWRPNRYTVAFKGNSPSVKGTMKEQAFTYDSPQALNANCFELEGHVFSGWGKAAEGGMVDFEDRGTVRNLTARDGAVVTLHAQWTRKTVPVTFTNGLGTVLSNQETPYGTAAHAPSVPGRTGYTFDGWDKAFQRVVAPLTVNAVWRANTYTVRFDPNGGTGTMRNQECTYDVAHRLNRNEFSRQGHTFQGWSVYKDGPIAFADRGTIKNLATRDGEVITMYAVWDENAEVRLAYTASDPDHATLSTGSETVAPITGEAAGSTAAAHTGYRCRGWIDTATGDWVGSDAFYLPKKSADGMWRPAVYEAQVLPNEYSVSFDANGGSGTMRPQAFEYDVAARLRGCSFERAGYAFGGWALTPDGDVAFQDEHLVTNLTDQHEATVALYAVWVERPPATITYLAADPAHAQPTVAYETLAPATGLAEGSTMTVAEGYAFTNWTDWTGAEVGGDAHLTPERGPLGLWESAEFTGHVEPIGYVVRFDANGGEGSMPDQPMTFDEVQRLRACTFARAGHDVVSWNTKRDGSGTAFADEEEVMNLSTQGGAEITLYAQWRKRAFTVTFDDGHTGVVEELEVPYGKQAKAPELDERPGYVFTGWDTDFGCVTEDLYVTAFWEPRGGDGGADSEKGDETGEGGAIEGAEDTQKPQSGNDEQPPADSNEDSGASPDGEGHDLGNGAGEDGAGGGGVEDEGGDPGHDGGHGEDVGAPSDTAGSDQAHEAPAEEHRFAEGGTGNGGRRLAQTGSPLLAILMGAAWISLACGLIFARHRRGGRAGRVASPERRRRP